MKETTKTPLKNILLAIAFTVLGIAFLLNISATALSHIEHTNMKTAIQKRDVTIQALIISCEIDFLIRQVGDEKERPQEAQKKAQKDLSAKTTVGAKR